MYLRLYSSSGKYSFTVGDFSSTQHHASTDFVKPTYEYAWKAYRDAKKLYKEREKYKLAAEDFIKPVESDETAESKLLDQYETVMVSIDQQCKGIENNSPKERKMVYEQIKKIVGELLGLKDGFKDSPKKDEYKGKVDTIISKFKTIANEHFPEMLSRDKAKKEKEEKEQKEMEAQQPNELEGMLAGTSQVPPIGPEAGTSAPTGTSATPPPMQATACLSPELQDPFSSQDINEIMDHYGELACSSISKHHPDVIWKSDPKGKAIKIVKVENEEEAIIRIEMDENLNVNDILPDGTLADLFPISSVKFYQRYWKPIVEALGYIFLKDLGVLLSTKLSSLPDTPNQFPFKSQLKGWDAEKICERPIDLSFAGEDPTWIFSNSKKTIKVASINDNDEMEFLKSQPARVRCIDNKITSLFNKVGVVEQIYEIPNGIGFELYVDFGRKRVWLSRKQVEPVYDDL